MPRMIAEEHTTKQFDVDLETVRAKVLQMGGLVEEQIKKAVESLHEGNMALAEEVIANDHRVNAMEVGIDEDCSHIIARRQPEAVDLRLLLAVIKTITDLERIGDEAEKIARMAKLIHEDGRILSSSRMVELRYAADLAVRMLGKALDAFVRMEAVSASGVLRDDQEVDAAFRGIVRQLILLTMEEPGAISHIIEMLFAAKAVERIGDHAKNIAEYVIFLVKGQDVRHISVEQVEQVVSAGS
jgi:phosphate transport system protein